MEDCKFAKYTANDDYDCSKDNTKCPYSYYIPHKHEGALSHENINCLKRIGKVEIQYNDFLNILVDLNKAINACYNGHGNNYMWRELSAIELRLREMYENQDKIFEDIKTNL